MHSSPQLFCGESEHPEKSLALHDGRIHLAIQSRAGAQCLTLDEILARCIK
jgi:hypothetical protein